MKARLKWESLAKQKDWTQVKPDLSVYRYSREDVTEDPRAADEYKDRVVGELGFGEDWKTRHPDLTEADAAAAREVLRRKAGAFWIEGTPRTTVRFVQHDTVPTGPPVRTHLTICEVKQRNGLTRSLKRKSSAGSSSWGTEVPVFTWLARRVGGADKLT